MSPRLSLHSGLLERYEHLLRDLPEWETEDKRRTLLRGILYHHKVWDFLDLRGSPADVAGRLIDTCQKHGPETLCLLLSGFREIHKTHPQRCEEIDFLASRLCTGTVRRCRTWRGSPYLGLTYFDRQHAPIFFGRDAVLKDLIQALQTAQGQRFTVVVGASGAGKSSLVRAGLWARLANGEIPEMPGSEHWLISTMTPTDLGDPLTSLRASVLNAVREHPLFQSQTDWRKELDRIENSSLSVLAERLMSTAPPDARWLLILDQMEELFAAEMKEAGVIFLDRLIKATQLPSRIRVVATLRADFFHHCLAHPPLKRLLEREGGSFLLGPTDRRSLEQMVTGPLTEVDLIPAEGSFKLKRVPWVLDQDLPAIIAADAERHPGGLALMAFALRELYEMCESTRRMDVAAYRSAAFGGLGGAIARRADVALKELGPSAELALGRVFVRLVRVNEENAATRLRESRAAWEKDLEALQVIQKFLDARLLVADRGAGDDPVIEVAHEALLREWPKLSRWIEERREGFKLAERVKAEAQAWMKGNRMQKHSRPFSPEFIDEIRRRLDWPGLLEPLLENEAAARLLTPEAEWILEELQTPETTNLRRWEIGRRLAEIGDPRQGVGIINGVPDILWRDISRGTVEIEGHREFRVEPFQMAAFPITFGQFRAFLDARDGYEAIRWWKDLKQGDRAPAWESPLGNHPVTDVSWFVATAFCRWLSARLGLDVRLPDEQEWQWAAQSGQAYTYPWGPEWLNGRANTSESDINRTTAVGMFPHGDSLQKVSDLAGNVWEWCRNESANPRQTGPGGEESRVVRGGSWFNTQDLARADFRLNYNPNYRNFNIGFRVVVSSPIR